MTKPPMFQRSADADCLIALMQDASVGRTYTYEAMNAALGRKGKKRPSALGTALNHLRKHREIVFLTVTGEGVRRAADAEIVEEVRARMPRRIRGVTKWAGSRLGVVKYDSLDSAHRVGFNLAATLGGAVAAATAPAAVKRLAAAVEDATKALPLAETLKQIAG